MSCRDSPVAQMPSVAVVLVNYNGWQDTVECVDSLIAQDYPNFHVFVVDNESTDGSLEQLTRWCEQPCRGAHWADLPSVGRYSALQSGSAIQFRMATRSDGTLPAPGSHHKITFVRSGANLGFAGGCNVGMLAAGIRGFDYFWLLNTDTVLDTRSLRSLVERAVGEPRTGMTGSTIRYYDRPDVIQAQAGARLDARTVTARHIGEGLSLAAGLAAAGCVERELSYIMGASMLVSQRFVAEVGLMQEDYFLYGEELDWALRGAGKFRLGYAPSSHVFHKAGASSSKRVTTFSAELYYRNRVRIAGRYFSDCLPTVRSGLALELLRHVLRGRWMHVRVVYEVLRNFRTLASAEHSVDLAPPEPQKG